MRAGAVIELDNGHPVAAHFGDTEAEYQSACQAAALFDLSSYGRIGIVGPEAAMFLQNISSNDIRSLKPGACCEAFLANAKAKCIAHGFFFRQLTNDNVDGFILSIGPCNVANVLEHLDRHRISEQVEFCDLTADFAHMHLAGPKAHDCLESATIDTSLMGSTASGLSGMAIAHPMLELAGFDLLCPEAVAQQVWELLVRAGARPGGKQAFEILRIESGLPLNGQDIDESRLAMEVGRTRQAISYSKGCFLGQEPIVRARDLGHINRSVVGLQATSDSRLTTGGKVYAEEQEVGQITSVAYSPRVGKWIALAYVRRNFEKAGTQLAVANPTGRQGVEVAELPFCPITGSQS